MPHWLPTHLAIKLTHMKQVLTMRKRIKATGFSDWDSMFYNNLLSVPVLIIFSLIFENWGSENLAQNLYVSVSDLFSLHKLIQYVCLISPAETRNLLLFAIAFSGAAAVGISYTTAWCIRVTSSTTYSYVITTSSCSRPSH